MSFLKRHPIVLYLIGVFLIITLSIIKAFLCPNDAIPILVIPIAMTALGVIAGPLGSLIAGIIGTAIVYLTF